MTDKYSSICMSSYLFIFFSTTVLIWSCLKYKNPCSCWRTNLYPKLYSIFAK